jgi:two-component system sensor histidine kinase/response regulator
MAPGGGDAERIKCLIVDDREDNRLVLSMLLRDPGVEVFEAASGPAALDLLLDHDFALALVDVQMPDMDGFELAELMRGSERTRHVPIVFVTAGAHDRSRIFKGYDAGAVDFLHKPVEPQILKNKAEVFFRLYRQQRQLARELAQRTETLRLNEMFTAVLGHDLRNPLNVILTGARVIERAASDELVKGTASRMLSSAMRMTRLIDDLLDLSRARLAGGIPLERRVTDLGPLVQKVVQEHEGITPARRIHTSYEGDLLGSWDGDRLAQAVSNLLGNALVHGESSGRIAVAVDGSDAEAVRIAVSNAGTIPADRLPHLFDPFSTSRGRARSGGLGLGLYIVQQIVQAHDGSVAVHSADGTTRFVLTIPRARVDVVRL